MADRSPFKIDGRAFRVFVPAGGIQRQGRVLDRDTAGRTTDGNMKRDIIGTYYNYVIQIDAQGLDVHEYDDLYEILSAPINSHTLEVPYGQGTFVFEAYVANVDDNLKLARNGINLWGDLSVTFTAMAPARR